MSPKVLPRLAWLSTAFPKTKEVTLGRIPTNKKGKAIKITLRSTCKADRDRNEIFEGDIVTYKREDYIVSYDEMRCKFVIINELYVFDATILPMTKKVGNFFEDYNYQLIWLRKTPKKIITAYLVGK